MSIAYVMSYALYLKRICGGQEPIGTAVGKRGWESTPLDPIVDSKQRKLSQSQRLHMMDKVYAFGGGEEKETPTETTADTTDTADTVTETGSLAIAPPDVASSSTTTGIATRS